MAGVGMLTTADTGRSEDCGLRTFYAVNLLITSAAMVIPNIAGI